MSVSPADAIPPVPPDGVAPPRARYLLPSERMVASVRRHPAILLTRFLVAAGVFGVLIWLSGRLPAGAPTARTVAWLLVLADLAWFGWHVVQWSHDRFLVTDKRILLVTGLLTRRVAMMPLRKVTDMTFQRSGLGRLLGYGAFVLESAGQEQALRRIDYLPAPEQLYLDVAELMFGPGRVPGPTHPAVVDEDP